MALRYLWRVLSGQPKQWFKNYNVADRAEKVLESEKRKVAPRHPGTETKFQVLIKGIYFCLYLQTILSLKSLY